MSDSDEAPMVGVGCVVERDGLWLLIRRRSPHGVGTWSTPGGYLDHGESIEVCATREVREETGLLVDSVVFLGITNDVFESGRHFVTIWMAGEAGPGDATPDGDEVEELRWFPPDALPDPLFLSFENLLQGRCLGSPLANSPQEPTAGFASLTRAAAQRQVRWADRRRRSG